MTTYLSTFPSGTNEIVEKELLKKKGRLKVLSSLDGLVIYETNYPLQEIRKIPFFNNSFVLLQTFNKATPADIDKMLNNLSNDKTLLRKVLDGLPGKRHEFKIVVSVENETVPTNHVTLQKLERAILRLPKMRLNIRKPDLEFWLMIRSEAVAYFCLRITYPYGEKRRKGELPSPLANILCLFSNPSLKDTFLDPFCGYGSIPVARSNFPYKEIIAFDHDNTLIKGLKRELKKKFVRIETANALELKTIPNQSIDKVVTDPPWGIYEELSLPIELFYEKTLQSFHRVLKTGGIAVILMGNPDVFKKVLEKSISMFSIQKEYKVLVSGKKATIFRIIRK